MEAKKVFKLVAYTDHRMVRMTSNVFDEAVQPYIDRIAELNDYTRRRGRESARLMALSRAYRQYGNVLMRCGYPLQAEFQYWRADDTEQQAEFQRRHERKA